MTKCKAICRLADDYGDNETTMHCDHPEGHSGWHVEEGKDRKYRFEWEQDERDKCEKCGDLMEDGEFCIFCSKRFCEKCLPHSDVFMDRRCDECKTKPTCEKHPNYPLPCIECTIIESHPELGE